jgi:hypothetical protein
MNELEFLVGRVIEEVRYGHGFRIVFESATVLSLRCTPMSGASALRTRVVVRTRSIQTIRRAWA